MRNAFAKLLEKDPVQSSTIDFRAGGNNVPILTRASASSTVGFQNMGLPNGSKPSPGGGANRTVLGAARMGDQDGNANASAGFNMTDIFSPPGQPGRVYPTRTFEIVGNNTFQPEDNDAATYALLKRLGNQQFKAVSQAPFEDYRAQQRLARDLDEASRNASISDLGTTREIIRNLAAERRQQNEDDYLRKMLDSGATPEAAKKEIEDVRNANAIQEAKKVDDRQYQAKTLIQRIAMSRGVTPMVQEPLNQSSSIDNPQRSQAMSQAMGMPGEGFGTSPLDMNRQFMTPEFYKKYLRKSALTQESADEQAAFNDLLARDEIPLPSSGAYSFATLKGQERQMQIENAAEGLASRLESIRARANRIKKPLPTNIVGEERLNKLYNDKSRKPGNVVIHTVEPIDLLRPLQSLIALNILTLLNGIKRTKEILGQYNFGTEQRPSSTLKLDLQSALIALNGGENNISIPFTSVVEPLSDSKLAAILQEVKTNNSASFLAKAANASQRYISELQEINMDTMETIPGEPIAILKERLRARSPTNTTRKARSSALVAEPVRETTLTPLDEVRARAATKIQALARAKNARDEVNVKRFIKVGTANANAIKVDAATKIQALARGKKARKEANVKREVKAVMTDMLDMIEYDSIDKLSVEGLKRELRANGLSTTGNKTTLQDRLKGMFE